MFLPRNHSGPMRVVCGAWRLVLVEVLFLGMPGGGLGPAQAQVAPNIATAVGVPDHPQPLAYNPTSIKDIRAADPGAGINLIEAPRANHLGDARLSYPIEVPPGRAGLQPHLAITYDSAGGNGWLGLGWDLAVPSITIDTHWGVPRYDPKLETETYLLNGEQLTPVAHRGELQARSAEKSKPFHTRVEGAFQKIVRHGTSPSTYWWEVTSKEGTRFFFGGAPELDGVAADALLADPAVPHPIFRWMLREVRDTHGNTLRYHYDVVEGGAGGEPWRQIYLSSIRYTGTHTDQTGDLEGPYEVVLTRSAGRPDTIVDGRPGFKTVLADRLTGIDVRLPTQPNPLIRRYTLEYATGQYGKTLLQRITQYGEDGSTEFNHHRFDYHDDVKTAAPNVLDGFRASPGFKGTSLPLEGLPPTVSSTALEADGAHVESTQLNLGASIPGLIRGGGKGIHGSDLTITGITLLDLDGDGLLDQVFQIGHTLFFNRNLGGPRSAPSFAAPVKVPFDIPSDPGPRIHFEHADTWTIEGGLTVFGTISGSGQQAWTTTTSNLYFADINADGLPDLVVPGAVYYNRLEDTRLDDGRLEKLPTFRTDNPVPVAQGAPASTQGMVQGPPAEQRAAIEDAFHLVDPIRRWVAPYTGTLQIAGQVRLTTAPTGDYATADGTRVTIQLNGTELWATTLATPTDLNPRPITGLDSVAVSAGDRLYFRVSARDDGSFDAVEFNPTITYTGVDTSRVDENGMRTFVYTPSSDFAYGGRPLGFSAPLAGRATLAGTLQKPNVTTDDVRLEIQKAGTMVHQQTVAWNQTGSFPVSLSLDTLTGEQLQLRIEADSRIDLTRIQFVPSLEYQTIFPGLPAPRRPDGRPVFSFVPPVTMQVFPRNASAAPYVPFVAPKTGTLHVRWAAETTAASGSYTTDLTLAVKRPENRLAKQQVQVRDGAIFGPGLLDAHLAVTAGDTLYFVADTTTSETPAAFSSRVLVRPPTLAYVTDTGESPVPAPSFDLHLGTAADEAFGGGFRGWSYGQYNGRDTTAAIDESRLRLPTNKDDSIIKEFVQMIPAPDRDQWTVEDQDCWIGRTAESASRLGAKFLDFGGGSVGGRAVVRQGGASIGALDGSVGIPLPFPVPGIGVGTAGGDNWSDVDFFDFNGDGYPDVVGNGSVQASLPNGALESARRNVGGFTHVRQSASQTTNVGSSIVLVSSKADGDVASVSTPKPSFGLSAGNSASVGTFKGEWDLIDINGDGLPDYIRVKPGGGLAVRLNLGNRLGVEEIWGDSSVLRSQITELRGANLGLGVGVSSEDLGVEFSFGAAGSTSTAATDQELLDVNGDGLVDIVSKPLTLHPLQGLISPEQTLMVRFNTGAGFTDPFTLTGTLGHPLHSRVTVSLSTGGSASVAIPLVVVVISVGGGHTDGSALGGSEVMLADVDGDGYADHIYSDTAGNVQVRLNNRGRTNLLKAVERPLGAVISLDYQRDGNTRQQPHSRWVLSSVKTFDGHRGDGVDDQVVTYSYEGGRYDRVEREFYGYHKVTEEQRDPAHPETPYHSVVREFANDSFYTQGLLTLERTQDAAGRPFLETANTYRLRDAATGVEPADGQSTTATLFPQLVSTERRFFEGDPALGKSTLTTHQYDALGNLTRLFEAGDVGPQDDVEATIDYSNCVGSYIVGTPTKIVVTGGDTTLRHREATVDCDTGNVTEVRQFLDGATAAVTRLAYQANGNLLQVTGPANKNDEHYQLTYDYDPDVQTHITKITDSFKLSSTAEPNLKYGTTKRNADTNGNPTSYAYDAFGRLASVTGPYQDGGPTPTIQFEYHPEAAVPWALTRHLDPFRSVADPIETVVFVDGLKRVLQTKKDATVHTGPDTPAQDVMIVSGRVTFDFLGRTVERFYPIAEPLGSAGAFQAAAAPPQIPPTRTTFDVLDRMTQTTLPDGTATRFEYGFGPDRQGTLQFQTTVTDANLVQKRTYRDVRGLTTAIQEFNAKPTGVAETIWTSFAYDPLKQLLQVTDDKSNVTLIAYDNLGRRTAVDNPDTGKTETIYDLASNPIARITANLRATGKQITYDYDFTRLKAIKYPDFPGNNVSYTYGGPGAPFNRAGRVVLVTDQSGSEERSYGKLGEVTREIKTVASATLGASARSPEVYATEYVFDTFGRLQQLTYPDGEVLTYRYDAGGLLREAVGQKAGFTYPYVSRLEYDEFEQRAFLEAGNKVRTRYSYNANNRRLETLKAGLAASGPFQNLAYAYDTVGNITSLSNEVRVPPASQFGGPSKQAYTYDDLYRLVHASGTYQPALDQKRSYDLNLAYDSLHNLLSKQQSDQVVQLKGSAEVSIPQHKTSYAFGYSYAGAHPHAATHIGDRTFTHDANGAQLGWTSDVDGTRRAVVWDEESRVQSISENGQTMTYAYDAAGERVVKRAPQGETVYVNQYFTIRNGTVGTKHVYAGTTRVTSKLVKPGVQEKDQFFYHPDHLGSTSYVTDANGGLYEHVEYFPFGETWVQEASNTQRTPYLFTAKELDGETGLYYFGARYYEPRMSQFLSPDPLLRVKPGLSSARPQVLAPYTYANNNPFGFVDPTGLDPQRAVSNCVNECTMPPETINGRRDDLGGPTRPGESPAGSTHSYTLCRYCEPDQLINMYSHVYAYDWPITPVIPGLVTAETAMKMIREDPNTVFPFWVLPGPGKSSSIVEGEMYNLVSAVFPGSIDPIKVIEVTRTSFAFETLPGHFRGEGQIVGFRTHEQGGFLYLQQFGTNRGTALDWLYDRGAFQAWSVQANNLRNLLVGSGRRELYPPSRLAPLRLAPLWLAP